MKKENKKQSFEEAMQRLDEIVRLMEMDETSLEKLVNLYEEGIQLSRFCQEVLTSTEKKMEILTQNLHRLGDES